MKITENDQNLSEMSKSAYRDETLDNSMDVEQQSSMVENTRDEPQFSNDLLRLYYKRLFPYDEMFNWLSYGNDPKKAKENQFITKDFFLRREFSFTMEHDIYIRYLSFADRDSLKAAMISKLPHKIDIGAVYTAPAKDHHTIAPGGFLPKERELVFDIDMTDYDDVRFCCSGASICRKCWGLMTVAIQILDTTLREDFGFSHLLWIYSGRRGVHCWVSDPRARKLSNSGRAAVANYLNAESSGEKKGSINVFTKPLHPMFERAYADLEQYFIEHVISENGQGVLVHPDRWTALLEHIPEVDGLRSRISREFSSSKKSAKARWGQLKATVNDAAKKNRFNRPLQTCIYDIVFSYAYPRLDVNVSVQLNHLLKSPWAVHPKTGRVCVPIDPTRASNFDPFSTPTLASLHREINEFDKKFPDKKQDTPDIEKTSLFKYVKMFKKDFLSSLYNTIRSEFRENAEKEAASTGDW